MLNMYLIAEATALCNHCLLKLQLFILMTQLFAAIASWQKMQPMLAKATATCI